MEQNHLNVHETVRMSSTIGTWMKCNVSCLYLGLCDQTY